MILRSFQRKGLCNSGLKAKSTTFECCKYGNVQSHNLWFWKNEYKYDRWNEEKYFYIGSSCAYDIMLYKKSDWIHKINIWQITHEKDGMRIISSGTFVLYYRIKGVSYKLIKIENRGI